MAFDRLNAPRGMLSVEGSLTPIGPLGSAYVAWSFVQPSLLFWFLAFAAFRLRKTLPPLRAVALQAGMVALWAVVFHVALHTVFLTTSDGYGPDLWPQMVLGCCVLPIAWGAIKLIW